MTVTTTTTKVSYTGDSSTVAFAVSYPFQGTGSSAEITVVERTIATGAEVTKTNVTHYAVTGGDGSTGTVTAVTAPRRRFSGIFAGILPKRKRQTM